MSRPQAATGSDRAAARHRGRRAETLALWWLRLKGYRLLARAVTAGRGSGAGEIDLIVRRGGLVAAVEVKTRPAFDQAAAALTLTQRRRIERGAMAFLSRRPDLAGLDLRFDVVLIVPRRLPRHLPDAWRPASS